MTIRVAVLFVAGTALLACSTAPESDDVGSTRQAEIAAIGKRPIETRDDADAFSLVNAYLNFHNADLVKIAEGKPGHRKTLVQGPTAEQNLNVLISFLSGYSVQVQGVKVTGTEDQACDTKIATEIRGQVTYGAENLKYVLSRANGFAMEKPKEDPCTCTQARLDDELGTLKQAFIKAASDYCSAHKLRCNGNVSNNLFADIFGNLTIGTLSGYNVFRGVASIANVDTPATEDALGFGVRCQQVFDGVVGPVIQSLRAQNKDFACLRIAEAVVINKGESFSQSLNGNHVVPALVPFHFRAFAESSVTLPVKPTLQGQLLSTTSSASNSSPASPEASGQLKNVLVNLFDPWKDGATNSDVAPPLAPSYTDRKDLLFLTPLTMGGQCEDRLATQRRFDKSQGRTFDPFCYSRKIEGVTAAALDKEYYCTPANGTQPTNPPVCPKTTPPPPNPPPPPPPPPDDPYLCGDDILALPSCTDFNGTVTASSPLVQQAIASAQCSYGVKRGGANICIAPPIYAGGFVTPRDRLYSLNPNDEEDYSSYYYFVGGACNDLSGNIVRYPAVVAYLGESDCPPPPEDPGGGGGCTPGEGECPPLG